MTLTFNLTCDAGTQPNDQPYVFSTMPKPLVLKKRGTLKPVKSPDKALNPVLDRGDAPYKLGNMMFDRRIIRGNTYAVENPAEGACGCVPGEMALRRRVCKRYQKSSKSASSVDSSCPSPLPGRENIQIQTELYLEELLTEPVEHDKATETDPFLDRPASPLFIPRKPGPDKETQTDENELFDFDLESKPILEVLVGRTIEQAVNEVMEEEELYSIREEQWKFLQMRNAQLAEQQRLEEQERRLTEEKERRLKDHCQAVQNQLETGEKIAAAAFTQNYLTDLLPASLKTLTDKGYFQGSAEQEIAEDFIPWLMNMVSDEIEKFTYGDAILDFVFSSVLDYQNQLTFGQTKSAMLEEQNRRKMALQAMDELLLLEEEIYGSITPSDEFSGDESWVEGGEGGMVPWFATESTYEDFVEGSIKGSIKRSLRGSLKGSLPGSSRGSMKGSLKGSLREGSVRDVVKGIMKQDTIQRQDSMGKKRSDDLSEVSKPKMASFVASSGSLVVEPQADRIRGEVQMDLETGIQFDDDGMQMDRQLFRADTLERGSDRSIRSDRSVRLGLTESRSAYDMAATKSRPGDSRLASSKSIIKGKTTGITAAVSTRIRSAESSRIKTAESRMIGKAVEKEVPLEIMSKMSEQQQRTVIEGTIELLSMTEEEMSELPVKKRSEVAEFQLQSLVLPEETLRLVPKELREVHEAYREGRLSSKADLAKGGKLRAFNEDDAAKFIDVPYPDMAKQWKTTTKVEQDDREGLREESLATRPADLEGLPVKTAKSVQKFRETLLTLTEEELDEVDDKQLKDLSDKYGMKLAHEIFGKEVADDDIKLEAAKSELRKRLRATRGSSLGIVIEKSEDINPSIVGDLRKLP